VEHVLQGFNSCCFAYGQTGSGKTHTMFGAADGQSGDTQGEQRGLIPRAIEILCQRLEEVKAHTNRDVAVVVSFLEIYCDQIRDLGKASAPPTYKRYHISHPSADQLLCRTRHGAQQEHPV
jgi:hypothetical protein